MTVDEQSEYEELEDERYDNENRCRYCGKRLKKSYEDIECWGSTQRIPVWICPDCG